MREALRFRSAVLFLSLPALWLDSFTLSEQLDPTPLSGDFSYIPVSIHASQSADYSRDPANNKFAPVNEDIFTDLVSNVDSPSLTVTAPVISPPERDDEEENSAPIQNSGGGRSESGSNSAPGKGHANGNAGGNGNAGENGKGKSHKQLISNLFKFQ